MTENTPTEETTFVAPPAEEKSEFYKHLSQFVNDWMEGAAFTTDAERKLVEIDLVRDLTEYAEGYRADFVESLFGPTPSLPPKEK